MMPEIHTHENPELTREEAIKILNTPDDQLDALIERAGLLRKKYKGNHVSIHILTMSAAVTALRTALTVHSPVVPMPTLTPTNG